MVCRLYFEVFQTWYTCTSMVASLAVEILQKLQFFKIQTKYKDNLWFVYVKG